MDTPSRLRSQTPETSPRTPSGESQGTEIPSAASTDSSTTNNSRDDDGEKQRVQQLVSVIVQETEDLISAVYELEEAYRARNEAAEGSDPEELRTAMLECIKKNFMVGAALGEKLGDLGGKRLHLPKLPELIEEQMEQHKGDTSISFSAWKEEFQHMSKNDPEAAKFGISFSFSTWKRKGGRSSLAARRAASSALGVSVSMLEAAVDCLRDVLDEMEAKQEEEFRESKKFGGSRQRSTGRGDVEEGFDGSSRISSRHRSLPSITTMRSEREEIKLVLKLSQVLTKELKKHASGWDLEEVEVAMPPPRSQWDTKSVVLTSRKQDKMMRLLRWLWYIAAGAFVVAIVTLLVAVVLIANR